ncbi:MAG: hypothetical protein O7G87_10695 [bacterium]|nr:hypothetical protein [bacterium]
MALITKHYLEALMAGTEQARKAVPQMVETAEAVAFRLAEGNDLYIASVRPDFVSEGYIRSGGLMMLKEYNPLHTPAPRDVILFGWSNTTPENDLALSNDLKNTGAFLVGIGPASQELSTQVHAFLESTLPPSVIPPFGKEAYPLVSLQNLILLWSFTGELVAALTRLGQMPAMYQSVLVPGARKRNASLRGHRFDKPIPPVRPKLLAETYLDKIRNCLHTVCTQETPAIEHAAQACTEVRQNGNRIHAFLISHFPVHQIGAPGDPNFMVPITGRSGEIPDLEELEQKLHPGDLFFFLGYYRRPVQAYEAARRRQCQIVEIITGTDQPHPTGPNPDYIIRPGWHYTDSLVPVPRYDVRILPASGILQTAIYWAVVGEMVERIKQFPPETDSPEEG